MLSGSFSGLNIGLMMARPDDLRRKARQGDVIAARVYRYRKDGYYLIFCILLGNVGVNTAMSILLGNMTNGVIGGLIATLLITMFGEILPQAIFTQRGYRFVRHFFWLLDVIYVLFWPLARPMSKLLNRWLGKETPQLYSHQELEQIIHEHAERSDSPVDYDESRIASGALQFSKKTAGGRLNTLDIRESRCVMMGGWRGFYMSRMWQGASCRCQSVNCTGIRFTTSTRGRGWTRC